MVTFTTFAINVNEIISCICSPDWCGVSGRICPHALLLHAQEKGAPDGRITTIYFIGPVTMLFAINSIMDCLITMKFYTFFLLPDEICSSHTMFINASTKEFTLVNNAISSYDISFEELLYYGLAPPIL